MEGFLFALLRKKVTHDEKFYFFLKALSPSYDLSYF